MSAIHPAELIERKRDGETLDDADLRAFLDAFLAGEVADYQMSAMLMAIFFRGLSSSELAALTGCIIDSGRRLDFSAGPVPAVDKHSTGGVGDKVSLVLAPLLAEYGLAVPMMSGRGLGHTGGTLDKLESIPGFRTDIDLDDFRSTVDELGCAMIGQTPQITPLDGLLYALRDVTGTVQSVPLIAASIVSKKVAEGISGLVLDVKVGRGAFMPDVTAARELAGLMVELAGSLGLRAAALLTAMDQPLGRAVGNALEVREAIDCLGGEGPADLRDLTLELSVEAVQTVRPSVAADAVRADLAALLDGGRALERFARLVERQGGDPKVVEDAGVLPRAPVTRELPSPEAGYVQSLDARGVGMAAVQLGAGRRALGDEIDPAVGFDVRCRIGDPVEEGQALMTVHARTEADAEAACRQLSGTLTISPERTPEPPLVIERVRTRSRP